MNTFIARITPSSVVREAGVHGRHSRLPDCRVEIPGKEARTRTAMCFGEANAKMTRRLVAGRPLTVRCAWMGRSLRIVGWAVAEQGAQMGDDAREG